MKILALCIALSLGAVALQDNFEPAKPGDQHKWLEQLVGDWTAKSEATMAPGAPPVVVESTEHVRSIGGLWILAEGSASMGGMPFTTVMTLGYDPAAKAYVGTWIDSMQTHLWHYKGQLDNAKKVLTLETEGPAFDDPSKTSKYRDVIELKDADHRTLSSSVQGADGKWTTFLTAKYERKKK